MKKFIILLGIFYSFCACNKTEMNYWDNGAPKEKRDTHFSLRSRYTSMYYDTLGIFKQKSFYDFKNRLTRTITYDRDLCKKKDLFYSKPILDTVYTKDTSETFIYLVSTAYYIKEYYPCGSLKETCRSMKNQQFYKKEYYPNGNLRATGCYNKDEQKEGIHKRYGMAGGLAAVELYKADSLIRIIKGIEL